MVSSKEIHTANAVFQASPRNKRERRNSREGLKCVRAGGCPSLESIGISLVNSTTAICSFFLALEKKKKVSSAKKELNRFGSASGYKNGFNFIAQTFANFVLLMCRPARNDKGVLCAVERWLGLFGCLPKASALRTRVGPAWQIKFHCMPAAVPAPLSRPGGFVCELLSRK